MNKVSLSEYLNVCLIESDDDVRNTELKEKFTFEEMSKALRMLANVGVMIG